MEGSREERCRHLDGHRSVMDRLLPTRVASDASPSPFPHGFPIKQLLRARHVAARPLPYAAVHAMRCPVPITSRSGARHLRLYAGLLFSTSREACHIIFSAVRFACV